MLSRHDRKRILVADRGKGFLNTTKSLLEDSGFTVESTENGQETMGQIKKFKYDLLVLGAVTPRIDGIRLLQIARKSKTYASVPMLFVSDYSSKEEITTRQDEIPGKAKGHIQKPFQTKAFLEMAKALLDKREVAVEVSSG